jgi:hypothetical protein
LIAENETPPLRYASNFESRILHKHKSIDSKGLFGAKFRCEMIPVLAGFLSFSERYGTGLTMSRKRLTLCPSAFLPRVARNR